MTEPSHSRASIWHTDSRGWSMINPWTSAVNIREARRRPMGAPVTNMSMRDLWGHYERKEDPWVINGRPMGQTCNHTPIVWATKGLPIGSSHGNPMSQHYDPMGDSWTTHWRPIGDPTETHGQTMDQHRNPMRCLWETHGSPVGRGSCGCSMRLQ